MKQLNNIEVKCIVDLQNINPNNVSVQVYSGKVLDAGILEDIKITEMEKVSKDSNEYKAKIALMAGGNYGYTFRVMPKHEMVLDVQNLNLVKWITSEMQEDEKQVETQSEITNKSEKLNETETENVVSAESATENELEKQKVEETMMQEEKSEESKEKNSAE